MAYEISLAGKVALVTGGARGIGAGIARAMARAGADVCIYDINGGTEAPVLVDELRTLGRRALFVQGDVTDRASVEALVAQCTAELGPVDILVNNAIVSVRNDILDTRFEDFQRSLDVGVNGTFHLFQVVARQMVERKAGGNMIYISSPHVPLPFKGAIDYYTAKAAGHNMAMSIANELMWHKIRVNILEPGWTDTPGERTWYTDAIMYGEGAKMPLGRLGTPEDLGKAAVLLASDMAEYVVSTVLKVNGGQFIQGPAWNAPARHGGDA